MKIYKAMLAGAVLLAAPGLCTAVIIGDFEGGMDGWYVNGTVATNHTTGVTLGSQSMQITDADGGWGGSFEFPMLDQANAAELVAAATQPGAMISADITALGAENTGGWLSIGIVANTDGYWGTGPWLGVALDGSTATLEFALDAATQAGIANGANNSSWANLGLMINGPGANVTYYVDNIQIIPEPATMGLVGIFGGGLLFIRRRTRI